MTSWSVLSLGARFHDLGKLALPDDILLKPGELTAEERSQVERHPARRRAHPLAGRRHGRGARDSAPQARALGRRQPDNLAAAEIPLGARVILAVSAYEAMLGGRPYRDPLSPREARAELLRCAGSQFDPRVVGVLIEVLAAGAEAQDAVSESSEARQSRSTLAS